MEIRLSTPSSWLLDNDGTLKFSIAFLAMAVSTNFPTAFQWFLTQKRAIAINQMEESSSLGKGDEDQELEVASGLQLERHPHSVHSLLLAFAAVVLERGDNHSSMVDVDPTRLTRYLDKIHDRFNHTLRFYLVEKRSIIIVVSIVSDRTIPFTVSLFR